MFNILSAKDANGTALTPEQVKADEQGLLASYLRALDEEPLWPFFGGMLYVNGNEYQVAPAE